MVDFRSLLVQGKMIEGSHMFAFVKFPHFPIEPFHVLGMYRQLRRSCLASTSLTTRSPNVARTFARGTPVLRKDKINYNISPFVLEEDNAHLKYKRVTAEDLTTHKTPPKRVKMLVRDFIHDSLYNPNYGYFPNNAVIFSPEKSFDYGSMND
jgi:hypothetical protein